MPVLYVGEEPDYRNKSDSYSHVSVNQSNVVGGQLILVRDMGVATLVAGTCVVPSVFASASNVILLTYYASTLNTASVCYCAIVEGVSFTISSSNPDDTNQVSWVILK